MKQVIVLAFLIVSIGGFYKVNGSGECGRVSPDKEAFKLMPCAMAAQDENAPVSDRCCAVIRQLGQNPSCLCAVMMSNTARSAGAKPQVSITIPKRCNLADRPVGYKCGGEFSQRVVFSFGCAY